MHNKIPWCKIRRPRLAITHLIQGTNSDYLAVRFKLPSALSHSRCALFFQLLLVSCQPALTCCSTITLRVEELMPHFECIICSGKSVFQYFAAVCSFLLLLLLLLCCLLAICFCFIPFLPGILRDTITISSCMHRFCYACLNSWRRTCQGKNMYVCPVLTFVCIVFGFFLRYLFFHRDLAP